MTIQQYAAAPAVGVSAMAAYFPPCRVNLDDWSQWTGADSDKMCKAIGHAFRLPAPGQDVYTLAANAVLRLILQHDIDPQGVGYLALGTESSTDNAAGAVIVRGLVDRALAAEGKPPLADDCEVPEYKHACLGGIYAIKGAGRYLAWDGMERQAIVVSADVAEYARGSSGEPTQGAGAVAMLLEVSPRLLELDLAAGGSSSAYRGLDFRKPFLRFARQTPGYHGHLVDWPIFNGKYSTDCYIDATLMALKHMLASHDKSWCAQLASLSAVFMHRPYHHMPRSAWATVWVWALNHDAEAGDRKAAEALAGYCEAAGVSREIVARECRYGVMGCQEDELPEPAFPALMAVRKAFRKTDDCSSQVENQLRLGASQMMALGNLYTAAMPAWLAAGLEQAAIDGEELEGELLLLGYGSGDAAEAIPARLVSGWQTPAAATAFAASLEGAVDLSQHEYITLHDEGRWEAVGDITLPGAVIKRLGRHQEGNCQDYGVAYYDYLGNL